MFILYLFLHLMHVYRKFTSMKGILHILFIFSKDLYTFTFINEEFNLINLSNLTFYTLSKKLSVSLVV